MELHISSAPFPSPSSLLLSVSILSTPLAFPLLHPLPPVRNRPLKFSYGVWGSAVSSFS